ncbi:MAG: hypothetical protein OXR73_22115 [Myxococcales bacterium]|nr:hypothetical protein [Myxococcales bacterium]
MQLSAPDLARWARDQYRRRAEGLLQACARSGQLALGTDAVREAISRERLPLLIVAEDAAGRRGELMDAASRLGGRCLVFGDKRYLGALFGRQELGVMGVLDGGIAGEVREAAEHERELAEEA